MKTSIESLISTTSDPAIDSPLFRNLIEDHLSWLMQHPSNSVRIVTAHQIDVYDFDWIGLLAALKIDPNLNYAVIRMNGGKSFTDVPHNLRSIKVPDIRIIQNLLLLSKGTKNSV